VEAGNRGGDIRGGGGEGEQSGLVESPARAKTLVPIG